MRRETKKLVLDGLLGAVLAGLAVTVLAAPVAVVLGEDVTATDTDALREAVLTPLLDRYAAAQGIEVETSEIDAFVANMEAGMRAEGLTAEDSLTHEERAEVAAMRRDMGRALIRQWKLNRALYAQYGGRIIYQQLGPEPLDAYREFLEEQQAAGAFEFFDAGREKEFWRYFRDDDLHEFMAPGSAEAENAFARAPWTTTEP